MAARGATYTSDGAESTDVVEDTGGDGDMGQRHFVISQNHGMRALEKVLDLKLNWGFAMTKSPMPTDTRERIMHTHLDDHGARGNARCS